MFAVLKNREDRGVISLTKYESVNLCVNLFQIYIIIYPLFLFLMLGCYSIEWLEFRTLRHLIREIMDLILILTFI